MSNSTPLIDLPDSILGERVLLRSYRIEDADLYLDALSEGREHLVRWLPWAEVEPSLEGARRYLRRTQANFILREDLTMGIFEQRSGRLLGGTGLHRINWEARAFEIGYWLRASAEGHGYMQETVRLLTALAFTRLDANRVEIRVDTQNARSIRVAERAGFVFEGTLRNPLLNSEGSPRSLNVYSLIPEDFARLDWARDAADALR